MNFKNKGYTLTEILMGVVAVAIMSAAIAPMVLSNYRVNNAQSMADQTITYSKIYARYLLNNDNNIRNTIANNNIAFIPWSNLKTSGYVPTGSVADTNSLGQTPCVAIMQNSQTKQLMPFLFFVGGDGRQKNFSTLDANNTISQIGGMAGVYVSDMNDKDVRQSGAGVFGNKAGWFLPSSTPYIQQVQAGCGAVLSNNSIVMNISMMAEYSGALTPDVSLHRFKDPTNPNLGDPNNTNTAQTDISLDPIDPSNPNAQSKRLYFTGNDDNGVYLQNKQDPLKSDLTTIGLSNGTLAANTLQPTKAVPTFTQCDKTEVGKMAQQSDKTVILQSQLQCTANPLQCQGPDPTGKTLNGYCYLPVSEISITYRPNTASFTCPFGYVDFTVPPVITQGNPPPNFNGGKWECWASFMGVCTNWQYVTRPMCSWASPQNAYNKTGIKQYRTGSQIYSIATGISAYSTWQQNSNGYDCNYSGHSNIAQGVIQAVTCTTVSPTIDYNY